MTNKPRDDNDDRLAELDRILSERTEAATSDRIKLRDAVCAYQFAEKARGTSVSAIKATLTAILTKAESDTREATAKLVRDLLDWCTRYYFVTPAP